MPSKVSDIHEISVIIGFKEKEIALKSIDEKYSVFCSYAHKYGKDKINIDRETFMANEDLFNRGLALATLILKKHFSLKTDSIRWSGLEDHRNDSSDIYCDGCGISLKDSSRIVRNNGFEQLLKTFTNSTIKEFKDPFWEFAPSLSAQYICVVLSDCYSRHVLSIKDNWISISDKKICNFSGTITNLIAKPLEDLTALFSKNDFKVLIKDFKKNGSVKDLYEIRVDLVSEVSKKVMAVLQEGIHADPLYVGNNFKQLLQYRDIKKLFGFSSISWSHVGQIPSWQSVGISVKKVYTDKSKLTMRTTGLQINIYTDIDITINSITKQITMQNQLRYKHSTFTCAPEANLHLLKYEDWAVVYPY